MVIKMKDYNEIRKRYLTGETILTLTTISKVVKTCYLDCTKILMSNINKQKKMIYLLCCLNFILGCNVRRLFLR